MEFGEENVYSSQIEIAEMDIAIGDGLQPGTKVSGLWITGDKQQTVGANRLLKQCSLLANHTKILHILNAYNNDVTGNGKRLPIGYKHKTAFGRVYRYFASIQHTRYWFV